MIGFVTWPPLIGLTLFYTQGVFVYVHIRMYIHIKLPDDSDSPGHLPSATDSAVVECHSIPHTVSFSG